LCSCVTVSYRLWSLRGALYAAQETGVSKSQLAPALFFTSEMFVNTLVYFVSGASNKNEEHSFQMNMAQPIGRCMENLYFCLHNNSCNFLRFLFEFPTCRRQQLDVLTYCSTGWHYCTEDLFVFPHRCSLLLLVQQCNCRWHSKSKSSLGYG
jgi:hypothetical protein